MSNQRPPSSTSQQAGGPTLMGPRGGSAMSRPGEKAEDFRGTIMRLISYLRPFWGHIALVTVFAIASTLFSIVSPRILGNVTNIVVSGYSQGRLYDQVLE